MFLKKGLVYIVLVASLILAGCGGGGGGSSNNPPGNNTSFHVNPGEAVTKAVSDTMTIEVPANAFPQGGDVVITQTNDTPPNKSLSMLTQPFSISVSTTPQAKITLRFAKTRSRSTTVDPSMIGILSWKTINDGWEVMEMGVSYTLNGYVATIDYAALGIKSVANFCATELTVTDIIEPQGLVLLAGTGSLGTGSLITVHGFNDHAESLKLAAQKLVDAKKFTNVYGLTYDWREEGKPVAQYLGNILDGITTPKSVVILGHSRGVVIVRYALEVLGKTKNVKRAYYAMGANEGSYLASAASRLHALWKGYLNKPGTGDNSAIGVANYDTPALAELDPNSSFLRELNQPHGQRGMVDYVFFGGDHDTVVGTNSGLAKDLQVENFTQGKVERYTVHSDHTELVETDSGINDLINLMNTSADLNTVFWLSKSNQVGDTGWDYEVTITNSNSELLVCEDLSMDEYNRYGDWRLVQWFSNTADPSGFLPTTYQYWGEPISAGGSITLQLHTFFDWSQLPRDQVDPSLWAKTVVYTLRYTDSSGQKFIVALKLGLSSGGIMPATAQTRSITRKPSSLKGTTCLVNRINH